MKSIWTGNLVRLRAVEPVDWPYYERFAAHSQSERNVFRIGLPRSSAWHQQETEKLAGQQDDFDCFALAIESRAADGMIGAISTRAIDTSDDALDRYSHARDASRLANDRWVEGFALRGCSLVHLDLKRYAEAIQLSELALTIFREIGERRGEGMTLMSIGNGYCGLREFSIALEYYGMARPILTALGNHWSLALLNYQVGLTFQAMGAVAGALDSYETAIETFRETGDRHYEAVALRDIGETYILAGRERDALAVWRQAYAILDKLGDPAAHGLLPRISQIEAVLEAPE